MKTTQTACIRKFGATIAIFASMLAASSLSGLATASAEPGAPSAPTVSAAEASSIRIAAKTKVAGAGIQLTSDFKHGESWHVDSNRRLVIVDANGDGTTINVGKPGVWTVEGNTATFLRTDVAMPRGFIEWLHCTSGASLVGIAAGTAGGAVTGCLGTAVVGCVPGAITGGALGGIGGAVTGAVTGAFNC